MSRIFDFVIVGGGLCGSTLALALAEHGSVVLIEGAGQFSGSSIPAGLFNPIMTRQGKRVWRATQALESIERLLERCGDHGPLISRGIIRPAQTEKQKQAFVSSASDNSDLCEWLDASIVNAKHPVVHAPLGALSIFAGGAIDIMHYCTLLKQAASDQGALCIEATVDSAKSEGRIASLSISRSTDTEHTERIAAKQAILCVGAGYRQFPSLAGLNLHTIKGQVIKIEKLDAGVPVPTLSGIGYVIDNGTHIVAGSSYEHVYSKKEPSMAVSEDIRKKIGVMYPAAMDMEIVEHFAGERLTVPRSYLPMIGPIDSDGCLWFAGGLGSKGLLMSAWISGQMIDFISGNRDVPEPLRLTFMS